MTLFCITNQMPDVRSCARRGDHLTTCDSTECKGCLPREAKHGMLCWPCWEKVQQAAEVCDPWLRLTVGLDRTVQRDSGGISGSSTGYIPIPALELARDEIWSYLKSWTRDIDSWVSNPRGAVDSIHFYKAVQTAIRQHPTEEQAHKVNRTRCPNCNTLSLVWSPPDAFGSNVTVTCMNCKHDMPQESFEAIALIEKPGKKQTELIMDAGQPLSVDKNLAEPFDPENPDHQALIA